MKKWIELGVFMYLFIMCFAFLAFTENVQNLKWEHKIALEKIESLQDSLLLRDSLIKEIITIKEKGPILVPTFKEKSLFSEVYTYIKNKLKCPEAMFSLAVHESGGFTSNLAKKGNNFFGIKWNPTADFKIWSRGDGHYKCGWNDWKKGVDYMAMWQEKMERRGLDTSSNEAYIKSLRKIGYATDPNHGVKVMNPYHNYFQKEDVNLAGIAYAAL